MPKYRITIDVENRTTKVEQVSIDDHSCSIGLEPIDEAAKLLVCQRICEDYPAAVSLAEAMAYGVQVGRRFAGGHTSAKSAAAARQRKQTLEESLEALGAHRSQLPEDLDLGRVAYEGYRQASTESWLPDWPIVRYRSQSYWRAAAAAVLSAALTKEEAHG